MNDKQAEEMRIALEKAAPTHKIYRVPPAPQKDGEKQAPLEYVRDWAELPAPFPTINARLTSLRYTTSVEHVAVPIDATASKTT